MDLEQKLRKIDIEIADGLKLKSADRLRNLINEYPNELTIWNKLAELYFESGFLDAAGRYWILMEPRNEKMAHCIELYEKSVNYSGNRILREITFRGEKAKLPEYSRKKLEELESDSKSKVGHVPQYGQNDAKRKPRLPKAAQIRKEKMIGFLFFTVIGALFILILIGLVSVFSWIF